MFHRFILRLALAVLAALTLAMPALAGGWAVVTLDQLPAQVVAGEPLTIGFTVRQHGQTLRDDLAPIVRFERVDAGESFTATAEPQGDPGHYIATLAFASAGTWNWYVDIEAFGMITQPLPTLAVLAAAAPTEVGAGGPPVLPLAMGVIGLIGMAGALLVLSRTRARWAFMLVFVGALVGVAGFASAANGMARNAPPAAQLTPAEVGQALFLAKGCIMCHEHVAVRAAWKDFGGVNIGPDLANLKADPAFLRRWLKNPPAIKPGTQMPTLGLSDGEIEALVTFLTANAER